MPPPRRGRQVARRRLHAAIVEAHAVDHGAILLSRNRRGCGLPAWGRGVTVPHSTKPKPNFAIASGTCGVLVEARRQSDRIGKVQPERRHARRGSSAAGRGSSGADRARQRQGQRDGRFRQAGRRSSPAAESKMDMCQLITAPSGRAEGLAFTYRNN